MYFDLRYAAKTVEIRDGECVTRNVCCVMCNVCCVMAGHKVYGMELKGLDIVRRDWCELAKRAGQ